MFGTPNKKSLVRFSGWWRFMLCCFGLWYCLTWRPEDGSSISPQHGGTLVLYLISHRRQIRSGLIIPQNGVLFPS